MARGVKIDNKKIQEIIASYALTNSYNATAKQVGVSANSVKNIINKQKTNNPEEYAKVCEEKKEEFATQANKIIDKALILLNRRYDTALKNQEEIEQLIDLVMNDSNDEDNENKLSGKQKLDIAKKLSRLELNSLSEITTSLGTLYDKMRIAKDEPTANNKLDINIRVVE